MRQTPKWPTETVDIDTGFAAIVPEPGGRQATLLVNGVQVSHYDADQPAHLEFEYMQHFAAVIDTLPARPLRVLHLGAAGCTMARWVDAVRPGSRQLAIEIDATLARLVREWFDLPRSPALRIRVGDARAELARLGGKYDVIIRDVFATDVTPPHLVTAEFVRLVADHLNPGGLYLANCEDRPPLIRIRREVASTQSCFDNVMLIAEPAQFRLRRHGNLVIAARDGVDFDETAIARMLRRLPIPATFLSGLALDNFVAAASALRDTGPRV